MNKLKWMNWYEWLETKELTWMNWQHNTNLFHVFILWIQNLCGLCPRWCSKLRANPQWTFWKKNAFVVEKFGWKHYGNITRWFPKTPIDPSVWKQSFVGFRLVNPNMENCTKFHPKKMLGCVSTQLWERPFVHLRETSAPGFACLRKKHVAKTIAKPSTTIL